jgi:hypothetical protein
MMIRTSEAKEILWTPSLSVAKNEEASNQRIDVLVSAFRAITPYLPEQAKFSLQKAMDSYFTGEPSLDEYESSAHVTALTILNK